MHFDQIQAPSGLAFTPTSPTIQPDICSDLILAEIDESSYFPFDPQSNPMGQITASEIRSSLSFKLTNDLTTSLWEVDNWCPIECLNFDTFLEILRTIDKDKYLMPKH